MRTHLVTVNTRQHKHINYEIIARSDEFHNMQLHRVILLHRQAQCTSVECINNRQAVSLQNSDGIPFQCHFIINNSISAQTIRSMFATQARGLNFKRNPYFEIRATGVHCAPSIRANVNNFNCVQTKINRKRIAVVR